MANKGIKSSKFSSKKYLLALAVAAAVGGGLFTSPARAGVFTWNGSSSSLWATAANWTGTSPPPGLNDTATFNATSATVNAHTTIDLGAGVSINTILFDTANAAAYTIGAGAVNSQTLTLADTGAVTMNSTVANNELFNAAIILGTATTSSYTFTNSSTTNSLTFSGNISGGTGGTAGAKTLTLAEARG